MHRWTLLLVALAFVVAIVGSLIPIEGRDIRGSSVSVSCGPALPAAMHWTGPPAPGGQTIMTGPDEGLTTSAWCEAEAGRWLRPSYLAGGALLGAAVLLALVSRSVRSVRWTRSETGP